MVQLDLNSFNQQVNIDKKYYNSLDIEGFSLMMKDPSYCYKFYWLEAIVKLISRNKTEATYDEIINEMIVNAWESVVEYHIHLSGFYGDKIRDNLEKVINRLKELSDLSSKASDVEILNVIKRYDKEIHEEKMYLTQNVPYKALSGFANKGEERISLDSSAGRLRAYYNELSEKSILLPYTYGNENGLNREVYFSSEWIEMIQDHTVSVLGWIQYEKIKWLQNKNPEVPGLIYKLEKSDEKKRKLNSVRNLWDCILDNQEIVDVFTQNTIKDVAYDIDHFIPWSFIMNDELWNLMPMDSSLNSTKSNKLPDWNLFFGRFAENQFIMYQLIHDNRKPEIRKKYESCYRDNLHSIWANRELYRKGNSKEEFFNTLEKNMKPTYDAARRQGYQMWEYAL